MTGAHKRPEKGDTYGGRGQRGEGLTLVLRSTHSWHDNVGLLRLCFFRAGSETAVTLLLLSRPSVGSSLTLYEAGDE